MKHEKIYVALIDEGLDVWRPVDAEYISPDTYKILEKMPEGEVWEYQPGDIVYCKFQEFSDGMRLVADKKVTNLE